MNLPIPEHKSLCDLCVPADNNMTANKLKLDMLIRLGYNVVAFNTEVASEDNFNKSLCFIIERNCLSMLMN